MDIKATTLQRADLTPKQRFLLLLTDYVNEDTGGKAVLTEADKRALVNNWQPEEYERREYEAYRRGFEVVLDAQAQSLTCYLKAESLFWQLLTIDDLPSYQKNLYACEHLDDLLDGLEIVEVKQADQRVKERLAGIVEAHMDAYAVVCGLAFETLDDATKEGQEACDLATGQDLDELAEIAPYYRANDKDGIAKLAKSKGLNFEDSLAGFVFAGEVLDRAIEKHKIEVRIPARPQATKPETPATNEALEWLSRVRRQRVKLHALRKYAKSKDTSEAELLEEAFTDYMSGVSLEEIKPFNLISTGIVEVWANAKDSARSQLVKALGDKKTYTHQELIGWDKDSKYRFLDWARAEADNPTLERELLVGTGRAVEIAKEAQDTLKSSPWYEDDGEGGAQHVNKTAREARELVKTTFLKHYADLVAYKALFAKVSEKYEVDLGYRVKEYLATLDDLLAVHNKQIDGVQFLGDDTLDFNSLRVDTTGVTGTDNIAGFEASLRAIFGKGF